MLFRSRSLISNMCEIQPTCSHIGCNVQCMRLFSCELMTFLMDHDHDVFDKNDMLLILFLGSVMDAIKKQLANQPKPSYKLG